LKAQSFGIRIFQCFFLKTQDKDFAHEKNTKAPEGATVALEPAPLSVVP